MSQNLTKQEMMQITSHFKEWVTNWDSRILNLEGMHTKEIFTNTITSGIDILEAVLSEFDNKVMERQKTTEEKAKAIIKNQEKPYYKSIRKVIENLHFLSSEVERLYLLQHRITSDNFKLREKLFQYETLNQ